jgi:hypothetical protein
MVFTCIVNSNADVEGNRFHHKATKSQRRTKGRLEREAPNEEPLCEPLWLSAFVVKAAVRSCLYTPASSRLALLPSRGVAIGGQAFGQAGIPLKEAGADDEKTGAGLRQFGQIIGRDIAVHLDFNISPLGME